MIPLRVNITNVFPVAEAPEGLNYFVDTPDKYFRPEKVMDFLRVAVEGGPFQGPHLVDIPVFNHIRAPAEIDQLAAFGYNFIGFCYYGTAMVLGQRVQGTSLLVSDIVEFHWLLTTIDRTLWKYQWHPIRVALSVIADAVRARVQERRPAVAMTVQNVPSNQANELLRIECTSVQGFRYDLSCTEINRSLRIDISPRIIEAIDILYGPAAWVSTYFM